MKFTILALAAATAVSAQAVTTQSPWSECINKCADSVSKNATAAPNCVGATAWKDNKCLCDGVYQDAVKVCLYRSDCNTDVPKWFDEATKICGEVARPSRTGGGRGGGGGRPSASASAAAAATSQKSNAMRNAAGVVGVGASIVAGLLLL